MSMIRTHRACSGRFGPHWRGGLAGLALLAFVSVSPGQVSVETIGGGVRVECGNSYGFVAGNTWTQAQFNQPYATALDSQGDLWVADFNNNDVEEVTLAGNRTSSITYQYAPGGNKHPFTNVIGVAVDSANNLYVLTTTTLSEYLNVVESFPPNLNLYMPLSLSVFSSSPATAIAVANDARTNIYISFANGSGGTIIRIPQPYPSAGSYSTVVANYPFAPSGLAIREDGQLAVSDTLSNAIYVVTTNSDSIPRWITGGPGPGFTNGPPGYARFNQPHGIAASGDGRMVVCDTMNNYLRLIDTNNNTTTLYGTPSNVWTKTCCNCDPALYAGWVDGTAGNTTNSASGREPVSVTISSNGILFVTELYYNLIRSVTGSGLTPVTSITSIGSSTNFPTVITEAASAITGTGATLNASVDPNGSPTTVYFLWGPTTNYGSNTAPVVLSTNLGATNAVSSVLTGLTPNTIIHYEAVAQNSGGTTNGGDRSFITTPLVTSVLTISPAYGYFPECQTITVTSSVPNIYYTEDGATPTTNSPQVVITQTNAGPPVTYVGTFQWCNSQVDLSGLQMITASAGVVSAVQTGTSSPTNQLGFVSSPTNGIGSTAFIPIVLDLQSGTVVESLQFRVEVAPNGGAPPISSLTLLPITSNDFVQMIGPAPGNAPVNFTVAPYTNTVSSNGQGLLIYALGSGTGLNIQSFGVVGLLEFQIPASASVSNTYNLSILYPSGTSDGEEAAVPMAAMANQTVTVADLPYLAGDSAPAYGYSAEEFGDGVLDDSDVNNAIYASGGIRVPPVNSDIYNAMCVLPQLPGSILNGYPPVPVNNADWNEILLRSEGFHSNWIRFWTNGGVLFGEPVNAPAGLPGNPDPIFADAAAAPLGSPPGLVWLCQASISAGTVTNLVPGNPCSLPVYANVLPGYSLPSLQFRAIVSPNGDAPPVGEVVFTPAANMTNHWSFPGLSANDILIAWASNAFSPPLQNSNYLGSINFQIPSTATNGQSYAVHFSYVDGSDGATDYSMESFPGYAWVLSTALQPASITSDEWKLHFFGSLTNSLAGDDVDADGDGALNWQEYLAGTDPTNPLSVFQFDGAGCSPNGAGGVALSWLTAPGKTYILESIPALGGGSWTAISTNTGDGYTYQFIQTNCNGNAQFYRILLQP
jgi:hypothetical protein